MELERPVLKNRLEVFGYVFEGVRLGGVGTFLALIAAAHAALTWRRPK